MKAPETKYAESENGQIAYQVFGSGDRNILFIPNWASNLEVMWEEPSLVRYLKRLASIGRVIYFDKRGTGVSDPVPSGSLPTLEQWMDDARIVLNELNVTETLVIGDTEGGMMAMIFTCTYPKRVSSLVLINTTSCWLKHDDYPFGMPLETATQVADYVGSSWGTTKLLGFSAPSMLHDKRFSNWFAKYQRLTATPATMTKMYHWAMAIDIRSILPSISVPTLVVSRKDNAHYKVQYGQYLSDHIKNSKLVIKEGDTCWPFHAGDFESILDDIEVFVTGHKESIQTNRVLSTIMFTDIVDSTKKAAQLGDSKWSDLLSHHNEIVRRVILKYRGREMSNAGDGFMITFDGPARSLQCASELINALHELGIEIRVGVHTGEIEIKNFETKGIAIHIAARIMALGETGQITTSRTIKDLVVGSGFTFEDRGTHTLKGVEEPWQIFQIIK